MAKQAIAEDKIHATLIGFLYTEYLSKNSPNFIKQVPEEIKARLYEKLGGEEEMKKFGGASRPGDSNFKEPRSCLDELFLWIRKYIKENCYKIYLKRFDVSMISFNAFLNTYSPQLCFDKKGINNLIRDSQMWSNDQMLLFQRAP